jgi:hypothetical protein
VLTAGEFLPTPGNTVTLFDIDGTVVKGICTAGGNAQVTLGSDGGPGGFISYSSDSSTLGHKAGQQPNGTSVTIADQTPAGFTDRAEWSSLGTFTVSTFLSGTVYAETVGSICVFQGSAIAANGAAPPAGQAPVSRRQNPR